MTTIHRNSVSNFFAGLGLAIALALVSRAAVGAEPMHGTRSEQTAVHSKKKLTAEWFADHLADPDLRDEVARRIEAHVRLTRTDMIAIFRKAAEGDSIDADQFQTLKYIVRNPQTFRMPAYVAELSRNVVLGNRANAHFQKAELGNLKVGSSAAHLDRLVKKWFLGKDLPAIDAKFHYEEAEGVLFDGTPKLFDIHQGALGDCYFIATLGETAYRNPLLIKRMFLDNHDGTFTVRFFRFGKPCYVTVDRQLPVNAHGQFVFENRGDAVKNTYNVLWAALAEKALAQLNESGWLKTAGRPGVNTFNDIGAGGKANAALQLIVGLIGSRDGVKTIGAFAGGELELANSKTEVPSYLVPHHSYIVVGYDAARGEVTLFNPWGLHGTKKDIKYGQFTMSWNDFWTNFLNIDHLSTKGRGRIVATENNDRHQSPRAAKLVQD